MFNKTFAYIKEQINTLDIFKVVYDDLSYIKQLAKRFDAYKKVLIFGIGGSSLGGKCLVNFQAMMSGSESRVIFIENVDSLHFMNTIKKCNPENTGIIVISKSGRTTETLMLFLTICEIWKNFDYEQNAIAITEFSENSDLIKIANEKHMDVIEHNAKIGGRFSVFSIVGLLPALLGNVRIDAFVKAARNILDEINNCEVPSKCEVYKQAYSMYEVFKDGKVNQHVIMPYTDMLEDYCKWTVQLISESLGKSEDFAITPIHAIGTVDQHSMLQLFLGGMPNKYFTIITFKHNVFTPNINSPFTRNINGHSLHELMGAHAKATAKTLQQKSPIRVKEYDKLTISVLGELMISDVIETIVIARLANINPFDQPAVEASKKVAMQYLNESKKS